MRPVLHRVIAAGLLALALASPAVAETVNLTLLLASDIYKVDNTERRGGFARLNAAVKAERAKGGHVIYAHAGDLISPSLLSSFDQGEHTIKLTNIAPPDIFTPGNHEFDFGPDVFMARMREAKFPVFAANLRGKDGQPLPGFKDTELRDFDGLKVGFVGLTAEDSPVKSRPGDKLLFASTFDTAVTEAHHLREQGADLVVAVVHAAEPLDLRLYESGEFDIILSGDDHDLVVMFNGKTVLAEPPSEAALLTVIDLQAEIQEKDGERSVSWYPAFRIIDTATVAPDPETQAAVDAYNGELDETLNVPIGVTTEPLDSRKAVVRSQEAAIGNLIADALREAVQADVAIMNGGGIRANRTYDAGTKLTRRDILREIPFGNRTVKLEISGADLLAALENGVSGVEDDAGSFSHVSGITMTADITKPKGQRLTEVLIGGKPLDPKASYTLATNDYISTGRDGYTALSKARPLLGVRDAKLMANDIMAYITARKTVSPKVEGRVKLKM
jgi:5'-nucleotidase/UDP-sugar diphosphatase